MLYVVQANYQHRATAAELKGGEVGSKTLIITPKTCPTKFTNKNILIDANGAGSALLVFQSVLPFLLFAGDDTSTPIKITIQGGTNVSFSLSYEYLDQVLLPALETFGIRIDRKLQCRGWSQGTIQTGSIKFQFVPLSPGASLKQPTYPTERGTITKIDISIIVPGFLRKTLTETLLFELDLVFPSIGVNFALVEDSRHNARMYTLLVAHTSTGLRFGRDYLYDKSAKNKDPDQISTEISQKVVDDLDTEMSRGGLVDEYLQDQLVVFQALASGKSSFPSKSEALGSNRHSPDHTDEPFGDGSLHTTTARWVACQVLPQAKWLDMGRVCEGVGWKVI